MASKLSGIELTRYDDLFKTDAEREADRQERIQIVPAAEVFPYSRQPYTIDRPTPDLVRLMDSIEHIGIAEPLSVYVDTYRSERPAAIAGMTDGEIARRVGRLFDLRPAAIVKRFGLKNPIFEATASYGHFGNRPYKRVEKVWENGAETEREIEYFGWEQLDAVDAIKKEFGL